MGNFICLKTFLSLYSSAFSLKWNERIISYLAIVIFGTGRRRMRNFLQFIMWFIIALFSVPSIVPSLCLPFFHSICPFGLTQSFISLLEFQGGMARKGRRPWRIIHLYLKFETTTFHKQSIRQDP